MVLGGKIGWKQALIYILAQVAGGLTGTVFSHLMFYHKIPKLIAVSEVTRAGGNYFCRDSRHLYPCSRNLPFGTPPIG